KGNEAWQTGLPLRVEAVALGPYPGGLVPRIVGVISKPGDAAGIVSEIEFVTGDALDPRGGGSKILAHVVPDSTITWGGGGFAAQLRKRYPEIVSEYKSAVGAANNGLRVGQMYRGRI